jgi:uncharacterized protein (TIGR02302 family)
MNSLSRKTIFPTGWQTRSPEREIAQARVVIAVENLLPRLWPAFGFIGAYLTLALLGLFALIAWPLQALLLAATITATGLSLHNGLQEFAWPRRIDGARKLERDSALAHRPLSERGDVLATGSDNFAQSLWTLHQARSLPKKFRLAAPRADWDTRDPQHLRWVLAIALIAGLVVARNNTSARLIAAFDSGAGTSATLDAWIDPPPYTGLPLTSLHVGDNDVLTVPQGSVLNLRVHGAPRTPGLSAGSNAAPRFTGEDGEYSANVILANSAQMRIQVGGHAIGKWNILAVSDAPPAIAFTAKPKATEQLATIFAFNSRDDYGIASVHAVLTPPRGKKLVVDLPLPEASKHLAQTSYVDLTSHPYAGLMVTAQLEARDAIGQVGVSKPVSFRLPARLFTDPLARALVEQRQLLAMGDQRKTVLLTLDALTIAPDRFYQNQNDIFLALRTAFNGVKNAKHDADIIRVEDLLWQTALKLERGGLLSAAEELRKLQMMLTAALASGAPQAVIDELLKRYNDAMQRYVQAMAANPPAGQQPSAPDTKTLGMDDVQTLMQTIQKLSQAGEREKAAQLLAVLQAMLENLHMSQSGSNDSGGGNGQSAQNKALNEAIQKFGGLMGKQRALLDKTFRQQQGQADPKDGGAQGLSKQQGDLQKELSEAMKGLDPKSAGKMRDAGKAMAEAQAALGRKDLSNAGVAQNQALESLRQGAETLSKQAESQGQTGKQAGGQDPLGRGAGALGHSGVKIPGPTDLARARAILEELRRRAGEMNRSQQERDYLDRLLKAF